MYYLSDESCDMHALIVCCLLLFACYVIMHIYIIMYTNNRCEQFIN